MDIRYLRFFIAVAEEGNFTRAAKRLNTAQPSLSNQIKRLEEIVGTPLFIRDKHQTHLTAAGREFLEHSYKMIENVDAAIQAACAAARAEGGSLTMGYIPGMELIVFPRMLPTLHGRFPGMNFRLITGYPSALLDSLQNGVLDFILGEPFDHPEIICKTVGRLPLVIAIPADHELAAYGRIPPAELAKYPLIAPAVKHFPAAWGILDSIAIQTGAVFRVIAEVDNALATVNAVQSGIGVSITPEYIAQVAPSNVLIRHLDIDPEPSVPLCFAYRKDCAVPQEILQLLFECLSKEV